MQNESHLLRCEHTRGNVNKEGGWMKVAKFNKKKTGGHLLGGVELVAAAGIKWG